MRPEGSDPADKCPVDHKTRELWLQAAKAKGQQTPAHPSTPASIATSLRFSLDNSSWESNVKSSPPPTPQPRRPTIRSLSTDREISTIPRAAIPTDPSTLNAAERAALPNSHPTAANNENESGHDLASGNWVYPSQEMFFNAMRRKGHEAQANDMSSVVPIHNAVNERAWAEIKAWEAGRGSEACGGPKLVSFAGDSKALTPRARWNGWVGYQTPFDRHDWVIDRCGKRIEYVIDFYSGKESEGLSGKNLSFYLDVRPKLNSWEGMRTRMAKTVGL